MTSSALITSTSFNHKCGMEDKETGPQTHDTALTATEEIYYCIFILLYCFL